MAKTPDGFVRRYLTIPAEVDGVIQARADAGDRELHAQYVRSLRALTAAMSEDPQADDTYVANAAADELSVDD